MKFTTRVEPPQDELFMPAGVLQQTVSSAHSAGTPAGYLMPSKLITPVAATWADEPSMWETVESPVSPLTTENVATLPRMCQRAAHEGGAELPGQNSVPGADSPNADYPTHRRKDSDTGSSAASRMNGSASCTTMLSGCSSDSLVLDAAPSPTNSTPADRTAAAVDPSTHVTRKFRHDPYGTTSVFVEEYRCPCERCAAAADVRCSIPAAGSIAESRIDEVPHYGDDSMMLVLSSPLGAVSQATPSPRAAVSRIKTIPPPPPPPQAALRVYVESNMPEFPTADDVAAVEQRCVDAYHKAIRRWYAKLVVIQTQRLAPADHCPSPQLHQGGFESYCDAVSEWWQQHFGRKTALRRPQPVEGTAAGGYFLAHPSAQKRKRTRRGKRSFHHGQSKH